MCRLLVCVACQGREDVIPADVYCMPAACWALRICCIIEFSQQLCEVGIVISFTGGGSHSLGKRDFQLSARMTRRSPDSPSLLYPLGNSGRARGEMQEERKRRTVLVVQAWTSSQREVGVNGIELLCFESVGSDTHEHFLPPWEEDKSGPAKFFEIS